MSHQRQPWLTKLRPSKGKRNSTAFVSFSGESPCNKESKQTRVALKKRCLATVVRLGCSLRSLPTPSKSAQEAAHGLVILKKGAAYPKPQELVKVEEHHPARGQARAVHTLIYHKDLQANSMCAASGNGCEASSLNLHSKHTLAGKRGEIVAEEWQSSCSHSWARPVRGTRIGTGGSHGME